ncbi:MAG: exodeoxyribonuclease III [Candidatus Omnitrophica bacterium]|nr:exodeoxyribonuclease III [Candidatus Omnitrophota bacterium]
MIYTFLSWNVNGIRAAQRKGLIEWLQKENPDVLAIQETKAHFEQLDDSLTSVSGYHSYWAQAERKGYSGVCVYSREKAINQQSGLGNSSFDSEGRTLVLEFKDFTIYNIYFPNGKMNKERLKFKLDFYDQVIKSLAIKLKQYKKPIILCGDFNTAHCEIDLSRPKENSKFSGFLPAERALIDKLIDLGMVDSFRHLNKQPQNYTWWDLKTGARGRNIGWRIDYFFIDRNSLSCLRDAFIMETVYGSDHCPVGIRIKC